METSSANFNGNISDVSAVAQPLAEEPTEIASNIKYHAHYTPHFSPFKFEPEQAYYATADSVRDRLINVSSFIHSFLLTIDLKKGKATKY